MRGRISYRLIKTISIRVAISATIVALSAGLTISILHIIAPAQRVSVAKPVSQPKQSQPASKSRVYAAPQRITMDTVAINAPVVPTGLTKDNDMDISPDMFSVAWYKNGPKPGEVGSAVIAGHYGVKDGKRAIFSDLHLLKIGDTINVADEAGMTQTFSVKEVRTYNLNDDATQVFTSSDGKAHLNLITCGGTWNRSLQTYLDRIVVFTDLLAK